MQPHDANTHGAHLKAIRRVFGLLLALLALTISLAAPDLDKVQALALQRYGAAASETVVAWRKMMEEARSLPDVDKLNKVNTFFNRRILYDSDQTIWQQEDYWSTPLETIGRATGDCEDFAISKYMTLLMLGVNNQNLRLIYVRAKAGGATVAHMVLGFYPQPTEEPMILDNMITSVRKSSQRPDLAPVFSFNSEGLWSGAATTSTADPTARLSRWRDVLERMHQDGL